MGILRALADPEVRLDAPDILAAGGCPHLQPAYSKGKGHALNAAYSVINTSIPS
jgi:hypothetical protein